MFKTQVTGLIASLFMSVAVHALPLNDAEILTVSIGSEGLTRVSIKGDKIAHIFCSPGNVGDNISHHESGHVFISPEGLPSGAFLTVMTASGTVQDLKLNVKKGKGAPIVLEPVVGVKASSSLASTQEKASRILDVFRAGGIAPGFEEEIEEGKGEVPRELRHLLHMSFQRARSFSDGQWQVHVFEGKNTSAKVQVLRPEALTRSKDTAMSLSDNHVKPQDAAHFFVIQQKKKV